MRIADNMPRHNLCRIDPSWLSVWPYHSDTASLLENWSVNDQSRKCGSNGRSTGLWSVVFCHRGRYGPLTIPHVSQRHTLKLLNIGGLGNWV